MIRRSWLGVAFGVAMMASAGCGGSQQSPAPAAGGAGSASGAADGKHDRFAVIPKSLDIPVFNYAKIGAERAAKELGNVDIEWRAPDTADQLRQKEIFE